KLDHVIELFGKLKLIHKFLNYFIDYYENFVRDTTLSPVMLRITPGGDFKVITRWSVAIHGQKGDENENSDEMIAEADSGGGCSLSMGIDLGVSELMTIDIRNNDALISETSDDKYLFSNFEGIELIKSGSGANLDEDLIGKLEYVRAYYYDSIDIAAPGVNNPDNVNININRGSLRDTINQKVLRIKHLWDAYFEAYSKYGKLLSHDNLNNFQLNLLKKYYLEAVNLSDKIKRSYLDLGHTATAFIAHSGAYLDVEDIKFENLRSFEVAGRGGRGGKRVSLLNRELSTWIRGIIADLMPYKVNCINSDVQYSRKNPYRTSKLCHVCKTPGKRGKIYPGNRFIEKGYGSAFICTNQLCPAKGRVINADLNAARNIAAAL
ncbi:MAG: zinc ribbon domain-containing protein, partial [Promethearchaeia archaeon]